MLKERIMLGSGLRMSSTYRVMIVREIGRGRDPRLHIVRDDLVASLCGLPRATLGPPIRHLEIVCPDCVQWLRGGRSSAELKKVSRPTSAK